MNKIKYNGELDLNGYKIPCYVLEDGTRVLSGRGMQNALSLVDTTKKSVDRAGNILGTFLRSKWLNPFINKDKEKNKLEAFNPITCYLGSQKINGYEATILVDICDAVLEARKNVELSEKDKIVAAQCEILIRSFAKVGIIALVDEATGYQYEREKNELQVILKTYISDEILEWQKTFQLSFYREIFRLWKIPFTPKSIKTKPQFIGHLTNKLIYENLPKGTFVLNKLKEKTPKTSLGNYKYKLHQSLTPEIGREALKKVLYSVEALASISETKSKFLRLMGNKYGQMDLGLDFDEKDSISTPTPAPGHMDATLKAIMKVPKPPKTKK